MFIQPCVLLNEHALFCKATETRTGSVEKFLQVKSEIEEDTEEEKPDFMVEEDTAAAGASMPIERSLTTNPCSSTDTFYKIKEEKEEIIDESFQICEVSIILLPKPDPGRKQLIPRFNTGQGASLRVLAIDYFKVRPSS